MHKFPWWQALWLSFFSRTLYQSVARRWQGIGSLYLLIVSALVVLPITMQIREGYTSFIEEELPLYLDDLPELTIENGQASTPEERPYIINDTLWRTNSYRSTKSSNQRTIITIMRTSS